MNSISEIYQLLTNTETIISTGGLFLILLIIFAENGLFFGFFLPGDTLLFSTGLVCATKPTLLNVSIYTLLYTICLAAYLGSYFGYYFGLKTGTRLYQKKDTLLFKRKYLVSAEEFFKRKGGLALVMGRFLPILRTFAPIIAGITQYDRLKFFYYNILGGTLWVVSLLLIGYFLGILIPNSEKYLELMIMGIVIITWIPMILTYIKEKRRIKS
jgi:membrane-associated protein